MNLLFICSQNKWRSRTAETVFKNHGQHAVRSAGTEKGARVSVTEGLLHWADCILVMEEHHLQKLQDRFPEALNHKQIEVLGIADDYRYMDAELVEVLEVSVKAVLGED